MRRHRAPPGRWRVLEYLGYWLVDIGSRVVALAGLGAVAGLIWVAQAMTGASAAAQGISLGLCYATAGVAWLTRVRGGDEARGR